MTDSNRRGRLIGYAAVLSAVLIWGAWIVFTRHAVIGSLTPVSVTLLRVAVPTLVLIPILLQTPLLPRGRLVPFFFSFLGAAPFLLLITNGMRFAPAADVGPLVPGTMPLLVALLSVLLFKEKLGWWRAAGFALCATGVMAIGGRSLSAAASDTSFGHLILLIAALFWASYTVAFRFVGLSALQMTALVSLWSTLLLLPFGAMPLYEAWRAGAGGEIVFQAVMQGLGSGLIALVLYNIGIARLGASRVAAFVALVPALATVIAIPVLGEWPDMASIVGVIATGLGVLLASGVLARAGQPVARPAE
jgi:drug/metabolite transporter (DMT)-like permease